MSKRFRWLSLAVLTALVASLALTGVVAAQETPDDGDEQEEETPFGDWQRFAPWLDDQLRRFGITPGDGLDLWGQLQRELERYGLQMPFGREFRFDLPTPDVPDVTPWFGFEFQRPDRPGFRFEVRPGEVLPFLLPDDGPRQPLALVYGMQGIPLDEVADALGLTPSALLGALLDGQSVAEIAEAQGVELDEVVAVILAPLQERVAQAVENGRLSEEEGDGYLADAEERIRALLDEPLPARLLAGMQQMTAQRQLAEAQQAMVESAAGALGLTVEAYQDALQDSTLWQLAEENGVTRAEIIGAARSAFNAAVQQAVADGLLTEAEGEVIKERLTDRAIERFLSGGQMSQVETFQFWPLMP